MRDRFQPGEKLKIIKPDTEHFRNLVVTVESDTDVANNHDDRIVEVVWVENGRGKIQGFYAWRFERMEKPGPIKMRKVIVKADNFERNFPV